MSNYDDWCSDCAMYGDDYYIDENGERVCRCSTCPFNDYDDYDEEDCDGID